jgi:hypothetical protein
MKRLFLATIILMCMTGFLPAYFRAIPVEGGNHWSVFELKKFNCQVDVKGLFYETTIEFEIGLTSGYNNSPVPGVYEINWTFSLVPDAVITDCQMQPAGATPGSYIAAEILDLTTAQMQYRNSPKAKPRLLLRERWQRQWDSNLYKTYEMVFYPVDLEKTPVIKISFLTPCRAALNMRQVLLPLNEFIVHKHQTSDLIKLFDPDHPDFKPLNIYGIYGTTDWRLVNGSWQIPIYWYGISQSVIGIAAESPDRAYLRTFTNLEGQFYQISVPTPLPPENRKPKNILIAVDLTNEGYNSFDFKNAIDLFQKTIELSCSPYDSVNLIYSGFIPQIYNSTFTPFSSPVLQKMMTQLRAELIPKLNTLPRLLREAVKLLNQQKKAGEIWLITNARAHADPLQTAMEIIQQSLNIAQYPLVFKIISNDAQTWPAKYINNQYYSGNDYLYENLARLSKGNFIKLRDAQSFDGLEAMLDCVAPAINTVEIDPEPFGGLCFSRIPLNQGRINFPITRPYYEIGLFDGSDPFTTHYFGMTDGAVYGQDVPISRIQDDAGWPEVAKFWYTRYVQERLLEPQSYETIKYIENISVAQRILTIYSGFVIPGPGEKCGFERLAEVTAVQEPEDLIAEPPEKSKKLTLNAFPNPFNSSTTFTWQYPDSPIDKKLVIKIFNYRGQEVRRFDFDNIGGPVEIFWDGLDKQNQPVASGIYLVVMQAGTRMTNIKITLLK